MSAIPVLTEAAQRDIVHAYLLHHGSPDALITADYLIDHPHLYPVAFSTFINFVISIAPRVFYLHITPLSTEMLVVYIFTGWTQDGQPITGFPRTHAFLFSYRSQITTDIVYACLLR